MSVISHQLISRTRVNHHTAPRNYTSPGDFWKLYLFSESTTPRSSYFFIPVHVWFMRRNRPV